MHFTIPGELTDLNTFIDATRSNRWGSGRIKKEQTEIVAYAARFSKIGKVERYPVRIIYCWYSKDNRKDTDNVAFAKKFINDGLVVAGVLENDSRKFVSGFADQFYIDKANPRVEVFIEQAAE